MNKDILNANLDDIVFEGRNKEYGAYVLRKLYDKHLKRGSFFGVLFFLLLTISPYLVGVLNKMTAVDELAMKEVTLAEPPPLDPKTPPPPPPPPPVEPPPPVAQIKFLPPVVREDKDVKEEEKPPTIEELKEEKQISNQTKEGEKATGAITPTAPPPPPPPDEPEPEKEDNTVFQIVEQQPSFPDGEAALFKYLSENIKYPEFARDNGIEGTTYVGFVVEKDGSITDVTVRRGVKGGKVCDEEAIRVVRNMPRWKPGRQNGKNVRVSYNLPVKFKLQ